MAVLDADLHDTAKDVQDAAKRGGLLAVKPAGDQVRGPDPKLSTEIFEVQFGRVVSCHVERIDIAERLSANAVSVYQLQNIRLFFDLSCSPPNSEGL